MNGIKLIFFTKKAHLICHAFLKGTSCTDLSKMKLVMGMPF